MPRKKKNITSKAWLDILEGDAVHAPNTRDNNRSKIRFTLEKCTVNKDDGTVRTIASEDLKWRT